MEHHEHKSSDSMPLISVDPLSTGQARKEMIVSFMEPLAPIRSLGNVTNIFVYAWDFIVYDDADGRHDWEGEIFKSEDELMQLLSLVSIDNSNESFSTRNPILHATLPDGSRICATMPPVADVLGVRIRCFPEERLSLDDLESFDQFPPVIRPVLDDIVKYGHNVLFSGSTNAGKTTFMNAMLGLLPDNKDNICIVEDVKELVVKSRYKVPLLSNKDASLSSLILVHLRNTPDRMIVGEIREPDAAAAFYTALNTGHQGIWSTIHANSGEKSLRSMCEKVSQHVEGAKKEDLLVSVKEDLHTAIFIGFDNPYQRRISGVKKRRIQEIVKYENGESELIYKYDPKVWTTNNDDSLSKLPDLKEVD